MATWSWTPASAPSMPRSAWPCTRFPASSNMASSSAWPAPPSSGRQRGSEFSASWSDLALCLGAEMPFEYKVVNTVEEGNQLSEDGFELFTILPPGPNGGPDRMYLRREKRRGQTPGFSRESKSD